MSGLIWRYLIEVLADRDLKDRRGAYLTAAAMPDQPVELKALVNSRNVHQ